MKHSFLENVVKNIIIVILLVLSFGVVQSSFVVTDKSVLGSLLVAVSILSVIASFGNFAFTYEKVKHTNFRSRLLGHVTTGVLMYLIGLSLEMTSVITQFLVGNVLVFDLSLFMLYIASVLYDFWDFNRVDLQQFMLYTPHFLTGAVIVKQIPNPVISLPLVLISHVVLDLTPHNDFDIKPGVTFKEFMKRDYKNRNIIMTALIVDYFLCAASFLWILFTIKNIWMLGGGVMGVLPDAIEQGLMVFGVALPGWQDKLQFRVSAKYRFISYPLVSILAIYLLLRI